jgi:hypothetical protein
MNLEQARAILELPEIFTLAELKRSYRDSLLVWHPDRFEGNDDLKAKATSRTQQINQAYQLAKCAISQPPIDCNPTISSSWSNNTGPGENRSSTTNSNEKVESEKSPSRHKSGISPSRKTLSHFLIRGFLWVALAIVLAALIGEVTVLSGICSFIGMGYFILAPDHQVNWTSGTKSPRTSQADSYSPRDYSTRHHPNPLRFAVTGREGVAKFSVTIVQYIPKEEIVTLRLANGDKVSIMGGIQIGKNKIIRVMKIGFFGIPTSTIWKLTADSSPPPQTELELFTTLTKTKGNSIFLDFNIVNFLECMIGYVSQFEGSASMRLVQVHELEFDQDLAREFGAGYFQSGH